MRKRTISYIIALCTLMLSLLLSSCTGRESDENDSGGDSHETVGENTSSGDSETTSGTTEETSAEEGATTPEKANSERKVSTRTINAVALYDISDDPIYDIYLISCAGCNAVSIEYDASDYADLIAKISSLSGTRFEIPKIIPDVKGAPTAEELNEIHALFEANKNYFLTVNGKPVLDNYSGNDERFASLPEDYGDRINYSDIAPEGSDFSTLKDTANTLYEKNGWKTSAPMEPMILKAEDNNIYLTCSGYPVEYKISSDSDFSNEQWTVLDPENGIPYSGLLDSGDGKAYIMTRNLFGESPVSETDIKDTALLFRPGQTGLIYSENFDGKTVRDLEEHWTFDPSGIYDRNEGGRAGGFAVEDGVMVRHWKYGRAMKFNYTLENYSFAFDFRSGHGSVNTAECSVFAIRQPAEDNPVYESSNYGDDCGMGAFGIYVMGYDTDTTPDGSTGEFSILEVAVHYADENYGQGAGMKSVFFILPEGEKFEDMNNIRVRDEGEKISVYCNDTLYCVINLSEMKTESANSKHPYSGNIYTKAELCDGDGNILETVENAEVPETGLIMFTERGNLFYVDNIEVELY